MGFGGKKKNKAAEKAARPQNIYSQFGSLTSKGKDTSYRINWDPTSAGLFNQGGFNALDATRQMGSFLRGDAGAVRNNPIYQSTLSLLSDPVQRQYRQDSQELLNNLNARNQVGSSYDALMNSYLMQNRDYNLNQASNQAFSAGLDALMNLGSYGQNQRAGIFEQMMTPWKMATGYQGVLASMVPQQQQRSNLLGSALQLGTSVLGAALAPATGGMSIPVSQAAGSAMARSF